MNPLFEIQSSETVLQQSMISALRESERRHSQLVQSLAAAIYTCDAQGYIKFYNKAAVELWGREPEIGKDLWCGSWKIYHLDGTPMGLDDCPMAKALKEGRAIRGEEIVIERPDGVRRIIMPHPDPIFDSNGVVVEAVNMLVDITDLKEAETELRESEKRYRQIAEELEKRVQERTEDLLQANSFLKRTNEELEQFAFIASHDMQEPLRKIKTFSSRLRQKNILEETSNTYLEKITSSSERMEGLINDVLNYSRTAFLDKQFVKTDLNEVLKNVLNDFEILIEEKNAIVICDQLPVLKAIPLQMNQLFHNLISNSLKFCKENSSCYIEVTSRVLRPSEAARLRLPGDMTYAEIIFRDNGIGFKQEFADIVFKIFQRLDNPEKYDGSGIGLALCRKVARLHGGDIFAVSQPGKGTAIHVILSLATEKSVF